VVDPTVVVKVEEPEVTVERIAEVVIAEEDAPPAPAPVYPMSANIRLVRKNATYTSACGFSNSTSRGGDGGGIGGCSNSTLKESALIRQIEAL
jgi:hypothetical protein